MKTNLQKAINSEEESKSKESEIFIRQQKVWNLFIQGFTQQQIADKLNVSAKTISRDFQQLKKESMEWMNALPEGEIQLHHKKNFEMIEKVIQELWKIYDDMEDDDKKLKVLNLIAEKSKMHIEMLNPNNILKVRQDMQHELKIKNMYGKYPYES